MFKGFSETFLWEKLVVTFPECTYCNSIDFAEKFENCSNGSSGKLKLASAKLKWVPHVSVEIVWYTSRVTEKFKIALSNTIF